MNNTANSNNFNLPKEIKFKAIVAMDESRLIGKDGTLPWHLPEDLKYFSSMTKGHTVLMGRKTYESLPDKYRPLPERLNVVLSRNGGSENSSNDVLYFNSIERFFDSIITKKLYIKGSEIWLIGGSELYKQLINHCNEVHITRVKGVHEGDTYLEVFEDNMILTESIKGESCTWEIYSN